MITTINLPLSYVFLDKFCHIVLLSSLSTISIFFVSFFFYKNISPSALLFPYVANYGFLVFITVLSNTTLNIFPSGLCFFPYIPKGETPKVRVHLSGFD